MESDKVKVILNFRGRRKRYLTRKSTLKTKIARRLKIKSDFTLEKLDWNSKKWVEIEPEDVIDTDEVRVANLGDLVKSNGASAEDLFSADYSMSSSDEETSMKMRKKLRRNEKLSEADRTFICSVLWCKQRRSKPDEGDENQDDAVMKIVAKLHDESCDPPELPEQERVYKNGGDDSSESGETGSLTDFTETPKESKKQKPASEKKSTGKKRSAKSNLGHESEDSDCLLERKPRKNSQNKRAKDSSDTDIETNRTPNKNVKTRKVNNPTEEVAKRKSDILDQEIKNASDDSKDKQPKNKLANKQKVDEKLASEKVEDQEKSESSAKQEAEKTETKIFSHSGSEDDNYTEKQRTLRKRSRTSLSEKYISHSNREVVHKRVRPPARKSAPTIMKTEDLSESSGDDQLFIAIEPIKGKRKSSVKSGNSEKTKKKKETDPFQELKNEMQKELMKSEPDQERLKNLMDKTFGSRLEYILYRTPSIREVKKTYPALFNTQEVIREFTRVKKDAIYKTFLDNLKKYADVIIDNAPASRTKKIVQKALDEEDLDKRNDSKLEAAILLLPSYVDEDLKKFIVFGGKEKNVFPMIVCNQDDVEEIFTEDCSYSVLVEMFELCSTKSLVEALFSFIAAFYIFSIEFPVSCTQTIALIESLLIATAPDKMPGKSAKVEKMLLSKFQKQGT